MSPFETLGISESSTADEVKAKWRELVKIHHPDRGGNQVDFITYREAYNRALEIAMEPKKCQVCNGSGREVISRGFHQTTVICRTCKGGGYEADASSTS